MIPTWIIQTNMGQDSDIKDYVKGVMASGANIVEVEYVPFSHELPELDVKGPIIAYGSVSFIHEIQKKYPLAVFGDDKTFTYEAWCEHYGDMLLNSPDSAYLATIGNFSLNKTMPDEFIFVRPQHDTKSLVGKVWLAEEFKLWCDVAKTGSYAGVNADTPIVVAKPYGIEAEWRLFVVDNKSLVVLNIIKKVDFLSPQVRLKIF